MKFEEGVVDKNAEGETRKIGLELEFAGLELETAARLIARLYGGEVREDHRYHYVVEDTRFGDFRVELDAMILKKMAEHDLFARWGMDIDEQALKDSISDVLGRLAKKVIPLEIVMPPVSLDDLKEMESLRKALQENKAKGTETSWMHAFGLHMNIEIPEMNMETLLRYFRAFLILYPWLLEKLDIDLSRRISPFIDHFPEAYTQKVLDSGYQPDWESFTDDYLDRNSTRNRPLDLLPLLAYHNPEKVSSVLRDKKNRPRPAFHYRLPNSRIDDSGWSFQREWEYWKKVEQLAGNAEMLGKLSELYIVRKETTVVSFRKEWAQTVSILLSLDE